MNVKKMCFIICVLIMLLSIASVSASENITDDKISKNNDEVFVSTSHESTNSLEQDSKWIEEENTTQIAVVNEKEDVLSQASDDALSSEEYDFYVSPNGTGDGKSISNPTNWANAMDKSFDGMKVRLLDGTFYINNQNIRFPHTTIVGSTGTVIDGQSKGVIFTINQEYNVLENITFINGRGTSQGGAVKWTASHGLINNCTFKSNSISGDSGGALYFSAAATYCTVNNTIFEKNSARNTGALWWQGQYGSLINCTFIGNSATDCHAAVFWDANDGNISHCNFINGYSPYHDAGFGSRQNRINVEYCNFTKNHANTQGGALQIEGGSYFTISNCIFNDNYAGTYAGALRLYATNSIVENCEFNNNYASTYGGAVVIERDNGILRNCKFNNNTARAVNGGGGCSSLDWWLWSNTKL